MAALGGHGVDEDAVPAFIRDSIEFLPQMMPTKKSRQNVTTKKLPGAHRRATYGFHRVLPESRGATSFLSLALLSRVII